MLKIKDIGDSMQIDVIFDEHVPLDIAFGKYKSSVERTVYWLLKDKGAILEVGVGSNRGMLRSITLVDIKGIFPKSQDFSKIQLERGIPVFEKIDYDENLFFENGPLEMFVGNAKVQVLFSHNKITSGLVCDRITCLFDKDNNFCGFEVAGMTDAEMTILKENFIDRLNQNPS